jgi:CheY-like chemotaxis protein
MSILIVEDDQDIRDALEGVLEFSDYCVATAADGQAALDYLRAHPDTNLVVLDLMMPRMNGYEFRQEQLKDPRLAGIPVIVVSALSVSQEEQLLLKASAFLGKPVQLEELLGAINKHIPVSSSVRS